MCEVAACAISRVVACKAGGAAEDATIVWHRFRRRKRLAPKVDQLVTAQCRRIRFHAFFREDSCFGSIISSVTTETEKIVLPRITSTLIAVSLCLGCSTARIDRGARRQTWTPPGTIVASAEELSRNAPGSTLAEALGRTLPALFNPRGTVRVSVDGSPPGDVAILSTIRVSTVLEVRLVRAFSSASAHSSVNANGDVVSANVVYVITRKY